MLVFRKRVRSKSIPPLRLIQARDIPAHRAGSGSCGTAGRSCTGGGGEPSEGQISRDWLLLRRRIGLGTRQQLDPLHLEDVLPALAVFAFPLLKLDRAGTVEAAALSDVLRDRVGLTAPHLAVDCVVDVVAVLVLALLNAAVELHHCGVAYFFQFRLGNDANDALSKQTHDSEKS